MKPLPIDDARARVLRPSTRGHGCYWCHSPLTRTFGGTAAGFCGVGCLRQAQKAGLP